jgi:hypothetical protein
MSAHSPGTRRVSINAALMPMLWFAPVTAIICWTAAWVFREHFEIMVALVGIGCVPILVALSAYLYVLVNSIRD